ncbi:MAG: hypothetical protein K0U41_03660, partial [Gammaproteobacteria bacterium]|nr:hypothetical protein [Gammaproteobacteria bacterium]
MSIRKNDGTRERIIASNNSSATIQKSTTAVTNVAPGVILIIDATTSYANISSTFQAVPVDISSFTFTTNTWTRIGDGNTDTTYVAGDGIMIAVNGDGDNEISSTIVDTDTIGVTRSWTYASSRNVGTGTSTITFTSEAQAMSFDTQFAAGGTITYNDVEYSFTSKTLSTDRVTLTFTDGADSLPNDTDGGTITSRFADVAAGNGVSFTDDVNGSLVVNSTATSSDFTLIADSLPLHFDDLVTDGLYFKTSNASDVVTIPGTASLIGGAYQVGSIADADVSEEGIAGTGATIRVSLYNRDTTDDVAIGVTELEHPIGQPILFRPDPDIFGPPGVTGTIEGYRTTGAITVIGVSGVDLADVTTGNGVSLGQRATQTVRKSGIYQYSPGDSPTRPFVDLTDINSISRDTSQATTISGPTDRTINITNGFIRLLDSGLGFPETTAIGTVVTVNDITLADGSTLASAEYVFTSIEGGDFLQARNRTAVVTGMAVISASSPLELAAQSTTEILSNLSAFGDFFVGDDAYITGNTTIQGNLDIQGMNFIDGLATGTPVEDGFLVLTDTGQIARAAAGGGTGLLTNAAVLVTRDGETDSASITNGQLSITLSEHVAEGGEEIADFDINVAHPIG